MFAEFDKIFSDLFLTGSQFYKKSLELLVRKNMTAIELCNEIGVDLSNATSDYLEGDHLKLGGHANILKLPSFYKRLMGGCS